jgi:hypothetical protein
LGTYFSGEALLRDPDQAELIKNHWVSKLELGNQEGKGKREFNA